MDKLFTISKESELQEVTNFIAENLNHQVILLLGEMGAGKTTFTKYLVNSLIGYNQVTSPTFSLINEYKNLDHQPIFHMDLYRLETIEEALNIGIEEYLDSNNLIIIEWPQLIESILPTNFHTIEIKSTGPTGRTISFI